MNSGDFMGLIGHHYDKIVSLFKSRSYNLGVNFDEDLFGDAFIKCAYKFGEDIISYDVAIKYFWVVYLNTVKSQFINSQKINTVSIDETPDIEDIFDINRQVYNMVMDAIVVKFGEDEMNVYRLYKYHNWTKEELISAGFDCNNLLERVKTIHKFVKEYSKEFKKSR